MRKRATGKKRAETKKKQKSGASEETAATPATKKTGAKKTAAKKGAVKKASTKGRAAKKKAAKKAAPAKTKAAPKKKASAKKTKKKRSKKKEPAQDGMLIKEVRARLGLIRPKLAEMSWLDGLYLYGAELVEQPYLTQLRFIVLYRGLRLAAAQRAAQQQLQDLLQAVLPLDLGLQLTGTSGIAELLHEGNPAATALLGHAEAVFTR